ncbi:RloB family protein [Streptomyces sp. PR69]|uniref:RloB family protein n=1 Tax=Streptomyces sp. PR69 TaxID=2984950 RepID=UPI002264D2A6|nr:RloB family protein [Streptomyces sp. PR69]
MASKFRSEGSKPRRVGAPRRAIKRRLLVVCGGARTEKDYFEALKDKYRNSAVTVKVRTDTRSPLHVVETAAELFESGNDDFDECWAVFDVDEFDRSANANISSNLTQGINVARRRNVHLAISNPCFEYWLLLHFCDHAGHLQDYKAVREKMKPHVPHYDKSGIKISDYLNGVHAAIDRARKRDEKQQPPGNNPNTAVWRIAVQMAPGK